MARTRNHSSKSHLRRVREGRRRESEVLERRQMMNVDWTWDGTTLEGKSDFSVAAVAETIVLSVDGTGQVTDQGVQIKDNANNNITLQGSQVRKIKIKTRGQSDTVDLRAVSATTFPNIGTSTQNIEIETDTGDDTIYGSQLPDLIYGDWGQDTICGFGGDDKIFGGLGIDTICGGDGNDIIDGGAGDDKIRGDAGNDQLIGDTGNDTLEGSAGADWIRATHQEWPGQEDYIYRDASDTVSVDSKWPHYNDDQVNFGLASFSCSCADGVMNPICEKETDFGDAPDTYGTSLATNGARHVITSTGPRLGTYIDSEGNGQFSITALRDDQATWDDEDGVIFVGGSSLAAGTVESVRIDVQNVQGVTARLDAWIDFGGNGVFDLADRIFNNVLLGAGTHTLSFSVPYIGTKLGPSYARFRISPAGSLDPSPIGQTTGGEVEDYRVDIDCGCKVVPGGFITCGIQPETIASLTNQLSLYHANLWEGTEFREIDFDDANGPIDEDRYRAQYGVRLRSSRQKTVVPEGGVNAESLDGYDGSYELDGNHLLTIHPNNTEPLEIRFDVPVGRVGSFVATGREGEISTLTIEGYDAAGNLLNRHQTSVYPFENPQNREGYWALESTRAAIAKIVVRNDNPTDFGNALLLDNLRWLPYEADPGVAPAVEDFEAFFAEQRGSVTAVDLGGDLGDHGIRIIPDSMTGFEVRNEGDSHVGNLDGHDGLQFPDGVPVLAFTAIKCKSPGICVERFTMSLQDVENGDLTAVGGAIHLRNAGQLSDGTDLPEAVKASIVRIQAYDRLGNLLGDVDILTAENADSDNYEGFFTVSGSSEGIGSLQFTVELPEELQLLWNTPLEAYLSHVRLAYDNPQPPGPDLNGDGAVDAADAAVLFINWGGADPVADLNADGIVDAADAGTMFSAWTGDPVPAFIESLLLRTVANKRSRLKTVEQLVDRAFSDEDWQRIGS